MKKIFLMVKKMGLIQDLEVTDCDLQMLIVPLIFYEFIPPEPPKLGNDRCNRLH